MTALGIAGNYFKAPLFYGIDFLFGSIFSILILARFGSITAIVSTLFISSYTLMLWNHPYSILIFMLEIIFVSLLWRQCKHNFTLAACLYWLFVGIPLGLTVYFFVLKMPWNLTLLVTVKQAINGVMNSLIAGLLVSFLPAKFFPSKERHFKSVFQIIFNFVAFAALIPSGLVLLADSKKVFSHVEDAVQAQLGALRTEIFQSSVRWRKLHIGGVQLLSKMISETGAENPIILKSLIDKILDMSPAFKNILILEETGRVIAVGPATLPRQKIIGSNLSQSPNFEALKNTSDDWIISPVFFSNISQEPTITLSSQVLKNGRFHGIASVDIDLNSTQEILKSSKYEEYIATIVDKNGNVIVSTDPKRKSMTPFLTENMQYKKFDTGYYYRRPLDQKLSQMAKWSKSYMGTSGYIAADNSWTLYVEIPLESRQALVYNQYIQTMVLLMAFTVLIMFASNWLASRMSNPLIRLSEQTSNLPDRMDKEPLPLVLNSSIFEIKTLVENYKYMAKELGKRFNQLQDSSKKIQIADRIKDEFLSTLSHELRTPLNIIVGHTEILKSNKDLPEDIKFSLDAIERASTAQTQLVSDLLDVSAITTGKINFKPTNISLNEIIKTLLQNFKFSAAQRGISLEGKISNENCVVFGDETRLQQIVWNLISNSIKFTPSGGKIIVEVYKDAGKNVIRVSDNGKGIDPEFLPHIFERFRQEDSSSTRKYGGLGLGLSIVYHLVELHGGTINAVSEGIGKGSTFTVRLPTVS